MVPEIQIKDIQNHLQSVGVYDNGVVTIYGENDDKFNTICTVWKGMLQGARQMPAYGVSLHAETQSAIQSGVWVEFSLDGQYSNNGMPFEKLLVNVSPEFSGFNIIRYTSPQGYDGRCFYFDLIDGDMHDFYNAVTQ